MIDLSSYVQQGQTSLRRWAADPRIHRAVTVAAPAAAGFCLSAASLAERALPLGLCLVFAGSGWQSILSALGAALGYWAFWQDAAGQFLLWVATGLLATGVLQLLRLENTPWLQPSLAALTVAAWGLPFPGRTEFWMYLLQIGTAFAGTWLFFRARGHTNPFLRWICWGTGILGLAQMLPLPFLGLGYVAAGMVAIGCPFPAAAIGGLALDLARITPIPMTAVTTLSALTRFLPRQSKWLTALAPVTVCVFLMGATARVDLLPLPGLVLGGIAGTFLPQAARAGHRRGETGAAQVRLEVAAEVLSQTRQQLMELEAEPVDMEALVSRAATRACAGCPHRKNCKDSRRLGQLPGSLLEHAFLEREELPIQCRKNGRFLGELHRAQEQLRAIRADRQRQEEYRSALTQQYQFLGEFLQKLADDLSRRPAERTSRYQPEVSVYGNRPEADNGDRCLRFSGPGGQYYIVLCDGMGTGLGAVAESRRAGSMLKRLLAVGYPAEHALKSLNSLLTLGGRSGAVTVDLVRIGTDSGRTHLYKWGAAPAFLLSGEAVRRIGVTGPPPGLGVTETPYSVHSLTLRPGQYLLLTSDGVDPQTVAEVCSAQTKALPGELAPKLLRQTFQKDSDDATLVFIRI